MSQISKKRWKKLKREEKLLKQAADVLRVQEKDLPRVVKRFQRELKEMEEKLKGDEKI